MTAFWMKSRICLQTFGLVSSKMHLLLSVAVVAPNVDIVIQKRIFALSAADGIICRVVFSGRMKDND